VPRPETAMGPAGSATLTVELVQSPPVQLDAVAFLP